jgi:hypothetical protein
MATTTPNYGWPVPTSTDYVKDGATAIEALGDAIDATVFGLPTGSGLTLINTTTFSAVASQSFSNVFTTTYDNYVIKGQVRGSTNATMIWRIRSSTTDVTTGNYVFGGYSVGTLQSQAFTSENNVTSTSSTFGQTDGSYGVLDMTIYNPFKTDYTQAITGYSGRWISYYGSNVNLTTSYDGITFLPNTGTITGSISIFGVQK